MLDWIIQKALENYQQKTEGKPLPLNERTFLDTFVKKDMSPITEKNLTLEETDYLRGNYYDRFQKYNAPLARYRAYLMSTLANDQKQKIKDRKLSPNFKKQYEQDLKTIDSYFNEGKIGSDLLNMIKKPSYETMYGGRISAEQGKYQNLWNRGGVDNVQRYEDYPQDLANRSLAAGRTPAGSIEHTLGRFMYQNRPDSIGVLDRYNFNKPPVSGEVANQEGASITGPYNILREWAGRQLPDEGPQSGREVNINLPFVNPNTYYAE